MKRLQSPTRQVYVTVSADDQPGAEIINATLGDLCLKGHPVREQVEVELAPSSPGRSDDLILFVGITHKGDQQQPDGLTVGVDQVIELYEALGAAITEARRRKMLPPMKRKRGMLA